jgi:hypothetical protein
MRAAPGAKSAAEVSIISCHSRRLDFSSRIMGAGSFEKASLGFP